MTTYFFSLFVCFFLSNLNVTNHNLLHIHFVFLNQSLKWISCFFKKKKSLKWKNHKRFLYYFILFLFFLLYYLCSYFYKSVCLVAIILQSQPKKKFFWDSKKLKCKLYKVAKSTLKFFIEFSHYGCVCFWWKRF